MFKKTESENCAQNFTEKVKKQAKNLLKLSDKNKLLVDTLSSAQEIMAKINGYPNWHALITNCSNDIQKDNINYPVISKYFDYGEQAKNFELSGNEIIYNYDNNSYKTFMVFASPGSYGNVIPEKMILNTISQDKKINAKMAFINVNFSEKVMNKINDKNPFLKLEGRVSWNILDKSVGCQSYSDSHLSELSYIFSSVLMSQEKLDKNEKFEVTKIFFKTILIYLENKHKKKYVVGVSRDVDKLLFDKGIIDKNFDLENNNLYWSYISQILFLSKNYDEAIIASRRSSFTFEDMIECMDEEWYNEFKTELFREKQIAFPVSIIDHLYQNIFYIQKKYNFISKQTNIDIGEEKKILCIDWDGLTGGEVDDSDDRLNTTDLKLMFVRKEFLKLKHYYNVKKAPLLEKDIDEYLAIFSEKNLLSNTIYVYISGEVSDYCRVFIREGRAMNYTVITSVQTYAPMKDLIGFSTDVLVSTNDKDTLKELEKDCENFKLGVKKLNFEPKNHRADAAK